jgi:putative Ca2+/H+ antiporter (TMEM165/GDT1 family)
MSDSNTQTGCGSFFAGFAMIMVSEIGDRTFLSNCVMAMKHDRKLVFFSAMTALSLMAVLSAVLGYTLPALLSKKYTQYIAIILFVVFGVKMIMEAREMSHNQAEEELEEVNKQLIVDDEEEINLEELESGGQVAEPVRKSSGFINLINYILSPTFVKIFTITFIAEWGDRSQIGTIILAASSNYPFNVILGTIIGHGICTALAVICGKLLAQKISVKTVTYIGGCLFILFGVYTLLEAIFWPDKDEDI